MAEDNEDEKNIPPIPLDEDDIAMFKTYAFGPYDAAIRKVENEIKELAKKLEDTSVVEECDMGLAPRSQWNLSTDLKRMCEEKFLMMYTCKTILKSDSEDVKYVVKSEKKGWGLCVSSSLCPTDVEEGMRVGINNKAKIVLALPPSIDYKIKMLTVEDIPDVTYNDVGGCKEQIKQIREVVEWPMLHPEKFIKLGLDPPRGVLCFGPPGTGKTLLAKAVANRSAATFIRVIGTDLIQKNSGEGALMVRRIFQIARSKRACIIFFDEIDAIGGERFGVGSSGDHEIQRTMLDIVNQLDGFDPRGNIKVLMATNRPDSLDAALVRPGRLDRKIEFGLPDLQGRIHIFKTHTRSMNCDKHIRYELLSRLCPNTSGADIRSVCTEAGMFAIRARRKTVTEKDFLDAVTKVVNNNLKFSPTSTYMVYN